jgi:putative SOS response-associated peptidase YedK
MCGRYLLRAEPELVARAFGLEFSQTARDLAGGDLRPRFNIAPTQRVPIVRGRSAAAEGRRLTILRRADGSAERELVSVRWGLIPAWILLANTALVSSRGPRAGMLGCGPAAGRAARP